MNKHIPFFGTVATVAAAALLLFGNAGQAFAATSLTRDLTLGSQGSDVTELQSFLIGHGFTIPAGTTGYFGAQTKAAIASYQAAHSIMPAAGYFGPATRASVNASSDTSTGTGSAGSTGSTSSSSGSTLSGGEATLRSFNLASGDDLAEGDTNQEIASAEFDVKGGDVRVQRVTLELTASDSSSNTQPWHYLDSISVYNGSKKVGSVNADSRSDWDKSGNTYSIDIPVDAIVKSGSDAELSIRADAQDSIDSSDLGQTFRIVVPKNGLRAVDAKGIQQYAGSDSDSVTLGFEGEDSGKLSVRASSDTAEAGVIVADTRTVSDKTDVLSFELRNGNDADVDVNELTVRVDAGFAGSSIPGEDVSSIIRHATLKLDGKTYQGKISDTDSGSYEGAITFKSLKTVVDGNDTADGTLTIDLYGTDGRYDSGATLSFDVLPADIDAEGDRSGEATEVTGGAYGNDMTVVANVGINLAGRGNTAVVTQNSNDITASSGTFTLKFDVTATGDDVYVPRGVAVNDEMGTTTAGARVVTMGDTTFTGEANAILSSTADRYNDQYFVVREGSTKTFTVSVALNPDSAGFYQVGLDYVQFSPTSQDLSHLQKLDVNENKAQFNTDPVYIPS